MTFYGARNRINERLLEEERKRQNSPENIKGKLEKETIQQLQRVSQKLDELWPSLRSEDPDSIRGIYTKILDQQKSSTRHPQLVEKRNELAKVYEPYFTSLTTVLDYPFPDILIEYFKYSGVDLVNLAKNMNEDIAKFTKQDLTRNFTDNKFRLSGWTEKISKTQIAIKALL